MDAAQWETEWPIDASMIGQYCAKGEMPRNMSERAPEWLGQSRVVNDDRMKA